MEGKQFLPPGPTGSHEAYAWKRLFLSRAKLKAASRTSALLSGFAMVAMVETETPQDVDVPAPLLVAFAVVTALLVATHLLALMISTCILPNIEAVTAAQTISMLSESPHEHMKFYVELAWIFSTGLGLLLFLADIALLCWVKFYPPQQRDAAIASTIVVVPVCVLFTAFAIHFYRKLVAHKVESTNKTLEEMESMQRALNVV